MFRLTSEISLCPILEEFTIFIKKSLSYVARLISSSDLPFTMLSTLFKADSGTF